jgi:hypothetical protein
MTLDSGRGDPVVSVSVAIVALRRSSPTLTSPTLTSQDKANQGARSAYVSGALRSRSLRHAAMSNRETNCENKWWNSDLRRRYSHGFFGHLPPITGKTK